MVILYESIPIIGCEMDSAPTAHVLNGGEVRAGL